MPIIQFTKNIPEREDKISETLKPTGFTSLNLKNIRFFTGYDMAIGLSIEVNGKHIVNIGSLISLDELPSNQTITIDEIIPCNNGNIDISIMGGVQQFEFHLNYEFEN